MLGTNTGPLPDGPATGGTARPARRRLLHLRPRRRPRQQGGRLLRHRDHARAARAPGPHHAGRHRAASSSSAYAQPRRDRPRTRCPARSPSRGSRSTTSTTCDLDREDDRDRDGAARQRRLPRVAASPPSADATTPSARGPTPTPRRPRSTVDAHTTAMKLAQSGGLGDNARGVTSMWTPHFLNGVFHAGSGSTAAARPSAASGSDPTFLASGRTLHIRVSTVLRSAIDAPTRGDDHGIRHRALLSRRHPGAVRGIDRRGASRGWAPAGSDLPRRRPVGGRLDDHGGARDAGELGAVPGRHA